MKKKNELPLSWPRKAEWIPEYRFHKERRWRFDWAFSPSIYKIAVEVNGGIWIKGFSGHGGAHSLPTNIIRDMEKLNAAQALGWRVFQFTPQQMKSGEAAQFVEGVMDEQKL